jgi:hypothetical protein
VLGLAILGMLLVASTDVMLRVVQPVLNNLGTIDPKKPGGSRS